MVLLGCDITSTESQFVLRWVWNNFKSKCFSNNNGIRFTLDNKNSPYEPTTLVSYLPPTDNYDYPNAIVSVSSVWSGGTDFQAVQEFVGSDFWHSALTFIIRASALPIPQ